jgi:hypothetical protein
MMRLKGPEQVCWQSVPLALPGWCLTCALCVLHSLA